MSGEFVALLLTFLVHVTGACVLVGGLLRNSGFEWRSWWPDDGPDDDGGPEPDEPRGGPPLPESTQAPQRLREPGRLGDAYPKKPRRAPSSDRQPSERPSVPS